MNALIFLLLIWLGAGLTYRITGSEAAAMAYIFGLMFGVIFFAFHIWTRTRE